MPATTSLDQRRARAGRAAARAQIKITAGPVIDLCNYLHTFLQCYDDSIYIPPAARANGRETIAAVREMLDQKKGRAR